jgi:hypothetical protein
MQKFNKTIKIEVSVDSIAQKMLDLHAGSNFPHAELLVETIIGTALASDKLNYIYNALNGFTNDIDFKVGQHIYCTQKVYKYVQLSNGAEETSDAKPKLKWSQEYLELGDAVIKQIDLYSNKKLLVEYTAYNHVGDLKTYTEWVYHTECVLDGKEIDVDIEIPMS